MFHYWPRKHLEFMWMSRSELKYDLCWLVPVRLLSRHIGGLQSRLSDLLIPLAAGLCLLAECQPCNNTINRKKQSTSADKAFILSTRAVMV